MTAIAAVVLGTVTYTPQKIDGTTARYLNKAPTYPVGYYPLALTLRDPVNGGNTYRVTADLAIPKTATVVDGSGVSTTVVVSTLRAKVEFILPNTDVAADRTALRTQLIALLGHASLVGMVDNLENIY